MARFHGLRLPPQLGFGGGGQAELGTSRLAEGHGTGLFVAGDQVLVRGAGGASLNKRQPLLVEVPCR
jgi:hypothetical protein